MKKIIISVILVIGFTFALSAMAAEFLIPQNNESDVLFPASETRRNLYSVGNNLNFNGEIQGDLTAAGAGINLIGQVEKDVMLAGASLDLSGNIGEDARVAGANIAFSGAVGGDVAVAGANVNFKNSAFVKGDVVAAAGNLILDAPVGGNVKVYGENVTINSEVSGDITVYASKALVFGPKAEAQGKIVYKGPKPAEISGTAVVSEINFTQVIGKNRKNEIRGIITLGFLIKLLAWFIAAFLLWKVKKTSFENSYKMLKHKPWPALGTGFAGVVIIPIAAILLFVSIVGYYLGVVVLALYLALMIVASLVAVIMLGKLIVQELFKQPNPPAWLYIAVGVIVFHLLWLIPFFGWVLGLCVYFAGFGVLLKALRGQMETTSTGAEPGLKT